MLRFELHRKRTVAYVILVSSMCTIPFRQATLIQK